MNISNKVPLYKQRGFRLWLMILPFIILTFLLSYLPLYGWVYAFFNFRPGIPLSWDKFTGLKVFLDIYSDIYIFEDVLRVLTNTLAMSFLGMAGSVLPMIFAVFLAEIYSSKVRRVVQTITTIPNFISWVLVYAIAFATFSMGDGWVNRIIAMMGGEPINFLASSSYTWLTMWLWQVWKGLGWGAIIYIAAIAGIDQEQYEAARIDGAGRFRSMWHITLPGLLPTFFVLLILSIGNLLNSGFDQYFLFATPFNRERIEVLALFVYNQGMIRSNYSFAVAVGMLQSLVSLILLFSANRLSKLFREQSIF